MSEPKSKEREREFKQFLKVAKSKKQGFIKNALEWYQKNVGEIVTSHELAQIPGENGYPISHNIRRAFELRDELGYNIINHKYNSSTGRTLKVDESILLDDKPIPKNIRSRGVNKRIMSEVFSRDNSTCKMCGRMLGDDDPFAPGRKIKLHVGHIKAHKRKAGGDIYEIERMEDVSSVRELTKEDFVTLCNVCNEGVKNEDIKIMTLLDLVNLADKKNQKEIFDSLKKKFS